MPVTALMMQAVRNGGAVAAVAAAPVVIHLSSGAASTDFDGSHTFAQTRDGSLVTFHTSQNPPGTGADPANKIYYVNLTFDNPTKLRRVSFTARGSGLGDDFTPGPIERYYSDTGLGSLTDPGTGFVSPTGYPFGSVADNQVVVTDFADQGAHLYWQLRFARNARGTLWADASGFVSYVECALYDTSGGSAITA